VNDAARDLDAIARWWTDEPNARHLGVRCDHLEAGLARASMTPPPGMESPNGAVQGSFLSGFAEMVLGLAMLSVTGADDWTGVISMDLKFLDPVRALPVRAEARVLRRGKRLGFTEATLFDADGKPCVKVSGISSISSSTGFRVG